MRIYTTMAVVIALAAAPGCKKNAATTEAGSAGSGSGSAGVGLPPVGSAGSGSAAAPVTLTGAALAQHYLGCVESLGAGAFDKYKDCLADGYMLRDAGRPGAPAVDRDAALEAWTELRGLVSNLALAPQLVLVDGRNLAAIVLVTGTAGDKKLGMQYMHRVRFDDANKQLEEWVVQDEVTLVNQLGLGSKATAGMGRPVIDKGMDGAPMLVVAAHDAREAADLDAYNASTAAFNKRDAAGVVAAYADTAVESDQAEAGDSNGKEILQQNTELFMAGFPDGVLETPEVWAAGEFVVAMGTLTGTNDKDLGELKATHKKVRTGFAELTQFTDGKVTRVWRFRNGVDLMSQLGLVPAIPDAGSGSGSGSAAK